MNPVARAEKIAAPNTLQTDKEIAIPSRIDSFQFICESDWLLFVNADYPAECPFFLRPIFSSKKRCFVTGRHQRTGDTSQICFRAAAGRKTAPNKSDVQLLGSLYLHAVSTIVSSHVGRNPKLHRATAHCPPSIPLTDNLALFHFCPHRRHGTRHRCF